MYKAMVQFTMGLGSDRRYTTANSYKELMEKVDNYVNDINGKKVTVLGYDSKITVEKVVYTYPSGKSFTKRF